MEPQAFHDRALPMTQRFDGAAKTSRRWDGVRKVWRIHHLEETPTNATQDQDLWYEDGNCLVHFHTEGSSQRGPSLKIPFTAIQLSDCRYLLEKCVTVRRESTLSQASDSGYESSAPSPQPKTYDLYVPAPANYPKEQAYQYHVTTRNYFACLLNQPLVGEKLGQALVHLFERMQEWQPDENVKPRLLSYCDQQGYTAVADSAQHAAAVLHFAEKAQVQELWTNSFAHCVGMHDRLNSSPDYHELSNMTKALITRAYLEMDLHIARAIRATGSFLEDEFGPDRLGLSKPARNHLDRFRCFLQAHYMEQLGYFPPCHSDPYDKQLWRDLHGDFQSLYELLADTASDGTMNNDSNASGGICCLQNTYAFDQRHGCEALPHPSPLLPPSAMPMQSSDPQRTLRSLRIGRSSSSATQSQLPPKLALARATNSSNDEVAPRRIVEEYRKFERLRLEEKITVQEARKVRWLLIYGILQMLKSINKTPRGVKDAESASYPLCVLTIGSPYWHDGTEELATPPEPSFPTTPAEEEPPRPISEGRISIHPDCEADNAQEYFDNSRRSSVNMLDMAPSPVRVNQPTRTSSIRNSVSSGYSALQRSFSVARRNSSRKSSMQATRHRRTGSYEIVAQGYSKEASHREALENLEANSNGASQRLPGTTYNAWQEFDFGLQKVAEEPTLSDLHLDSAFGLDYLSMPAKQVTESEHISNLRRLAEADETGPSSRNSWAGSDAAFTTDRDLHFEDPVSATTCSSDPDSLRSSYLAEDCDTPVTTYSSPGQSPFSSPRASFSLTLDKPHRTPSMLQSVRTKHISFVETRNDTGTTVRQSLNAGCYSPSGVPSTSSVMPALSKFSQHRPELDLRAAAGIARSGF
ncbi:hypothetical protein Q7P37_002674 [Cladosporium fusiforme]